MIIYLELLDTQEEKDIFEALYNRYKDYMYHIAYQILQNDHDAEDAVHQSFLSIIKHLNKMSDIRCRKTRSYLVVVVENKSIDIIRDRMKYSLNDCEDKLFGVEIDLPGDSGLADALSMLPARYREVLLLKYDNGYSTKEIARMFNIHQESAQRLIHRAKEKLGEILNEEGYNLE